MLLLIYSVVMSCVRVLSRFRSGALAIGNPVQKSLTLFILFKIGPVENLTFFFFFFFLYFQF